MLDGVVVQHLAVEVGRFTLMKLGVTEMSPGSWTAGIQPFMTAVTVKMLGSSVIRQVSVFGSVWVYMLHHVT